MSCKSLKTSLQIHTNTSYIKVCLHTSLIDPWQCSAWALKRYSSGLCEMCVVQETCGSRRAQQCHRCDSDKVFLLLRVKHKLLQFIDLRFFTSQRQIYSRTLTSEQLRHSGQERIPLVKKEVKKMWFLIKWKPNYLVQSDIMGCEKLRCEKSNYQSHSYFDRGWKLLIISIELKQ